MKLLNFKPNIDVASLLLRVSLGGMFFLHGIGKPFVVGMDAVIPGFIEQGFPVWTAFASTVVEIGGGVLLLAGYRVRLAVAALLPVSFGILLYHFPRGWVFHNPDGGWEYPQLIIVGLLALFFLGGGKYGLQNERA